MKDSHESIIKIEQSSDIKALLHTKEQLKEKIIKPMHWEERMEFYKQIHAINIRIQTLLGN